LSDDFHMLAGDARFLAQFAQGRGFGVLVLVYAALGHLPGVGRVVDSMTHEDLPVHVDEHDAYAGAIAAIFILWHGRRESLSSSSRRDAGAIADRDRR